MPRLARLDAPVVLHHIMIRGIERRNIFRNNKDRKDFLDRLSNLDSVAMRVTEIYEIEVEDIFFGRQTSEKGQSKESFLLLGSSRAGYFPY